MGISFNDIPGTINTPGFFTEVDSSRAVSGLSPRPNVSLLIGIKLAAGTATADVPVLVGSPDAGEGLFGRGSMLAGMVRAYKGQNPNSELWCVPQDEAAGTAATGTITFSGTATEAGTIFLYIGGKRIQVPVAVDDTATDVGDGVDAALILPENTDVYATSVNTTGAVAFTVKWDGTHGNELDIRLNAGEGESLPAGITADVDRAVMASGATDPDITTATAALGSTAYQFVGSGLNDATNMTALQAFLQGRWDPMVQLEGVSAVGFNDTVANTTTKGNASNSQFMSIVSGGEALSPPWEIAAAALGMAAKQYGIDPARPMQNKQLLNMVGPSKVDDFTRAERDVLLDDGVATTKPRQGDRAMLMERFRTSYQTNSLAVPDPAFKDVNTMMTLIALRYDVRSRFSLRYPNHKLAADGTEFSPGQAIVTPSVARGEILGLYREWILAGLCEDAAGFETDLVVQINGTDKSRLDVQMAPRLIQGFRVGAFQLQFILGTPQVAA